MIKNSLCFFVLCGLLVCAQDWAIKYQDKVWSQKDFYRFFPKNDWLQLDNKEKRGKVLTSFLKPLAPETIFLVKFFKYFDNGRLMKINPS